MFSYRMSKSQRRESAEAAGMYPKPGDPDGVLRVNSGDDFGSPYHGFPMPPIFPNTLQWQFKSAYDVDGSNVWDIANTGTGTPLACQDGRGGWAKSVNGVTDNNYYSYQSKYKPIALVAGKNLWLVTEIKVKTVNQADLFVGLTPAIATTAIFDAWVDVVGFYLNDGQGGLLRCVTSNGSALTLKSTGVSMADDVAIKLCIKIEGVSQAYFYVNDIPKAVSKAYIPTTNMGFAFALRNGEGAANELSINTVFIGMDR